MFEILKTLVYLPWVELTGFLVYLPLSTIWTTPKIVRKKICLGYHPLISRGTRIFPIGVLRSAWQ